MNYPSFESKRIDLFAYLETIKDDGSTTTDESLIDVFSLKEKLTSTECFFIYNLKRNSIDYHFGLEQMLGQTSGEIDLEFFLQRMSKEDRRDIEIIIQEAVGQIISQNVPLGLNYLNLSFKMKTDFGESLHIISNNIVFSRDIHGRPVSILVKYSNLDFIKAPLIAQWWVDNKYLDSLRILKKLSAGRDGLLTKREREIVALIIKRNSSSQIANRLNISPHTVVSHRKNIFKKCECHTVEELDVFCRKNRLT